MPVWTVLEVQPHEGDNSILTAQIQTDEEGVVLRPHIPLWRDDLEFAVAWLLEQGGGMCVVAHRRDDIYTREEP